jgi:hypothetical protein
MKTQSPYGLNKLPLCITAFVVVYKLRREYSRRPSNMTATQTASEILTTTLPTCRPPPKLRRKYYRQHSRRAARHPNCVGNITDDPPTCPPPKLRRKYYRRPSNMPATQTASEILPTTLQHARHPNCVGNITDDPPTCPTPKLRRKYYRQHSRRAARHPNCVGNIPDNATDTYPPPTVLPDPSRNSHNASKTLNPYDSNIIPLCKTSAPAFVVVQSISSNIPPKEVGIQTKEV